LLVSPAGPFSTNDSLYRQMPYDLKTAFAPIALLAQAPTVLVVNPQVAAKSVAELVALAKQNPGKINYASQGVGSIAHLSAAMFASMARIDLVHVAYKGSGPALTDLISGQVQMMFENTNSSAEHVKHGTLRPLAVGSVKRSPILPDVPTMVESGFPDFASVQWFAAAAPAGTPADIVALLSRKISEALRNPATAQKLANVGVEPLGSTPQEMAKFVAEEMARWHKVIRDAGLKPG